MTPRVVEWAPHCANFSRGRGREASFTTFYKIALYRPDGEV